jgi:hypothetical protein
MRKTSPRQRKTIVRVSARKTRRGRSRVGARAMGAKNARRLTARGRKAASSRARVAGGPTKAALYRRAKRAGIEGRSKMSKRQLQVALSR